MVKVRTLKSYQVLINKAGTMFRYTNRVLHHDILPAVESPANFVSFPKEIKIWYNNGQIVAAQEDERRMQQASGKDIEKVYRGHKRKVFRKKIVLRLSSVTALRVAFIFLMYMLGVFISTYLF